MWNDVGSDFFGEKMLWMSVLRRAVFDFVLYRGIRKHKKRWLLSRQYIFDREVEYEDTLSFDQVCSLFNWEPDHIRRMVSNLRRQDIKKLEAMRFRADFKAEPTDGFTPVRVSFEVGPAPSVGFHHYGRDFRRKLELRKAPAPCLGSMAPIVSWQNT